MHKKNPKIHYFTLHAGEHPGDSYTDVPSFVTCSYCKKIIRRKLEISAKLERANKANKLIKVIGSLGHKFFRHKRKDGPVSKFVIDHHGHVWFWDAYTEKDIYTHDTAGRWRGFSEGGTLRDVIVRLRDYIRTGKHCANVFGPWPEWYSGGDPWGYGDNMQKVRDAAIELGIIEKPDISKGIEQ